MRARAWFEPDGPHEKTIFRVACLALMPMIIGMVRGEYGKEQSIEQSANHLHPRY